MLIPSISLSFCYYCHVYYCYALVCVTEKHILAWQTLKETEVQDFE